MTLWSCKVKKEDKVGAGPQKMAVNLSLIEQYAPALQLLPHSSAAPCQGDLYSLHLIAHRCISVQADRKEFLQTTAVISGDRCNKLTVSIHNK